MAAVLNCWKRSFKAVSSSSGISPPRTLAISASISSRRLCKSATRAAGSRSLPCVICFRSSNKVMRRDSVPTNARCVSVPSQAMALLGGRHPGRTAVRPNRPHRTCATILSHWLAQSRSDTPAPGLGKVSGPGVSRRADTNSSSSASARSDCAMTRTLGAMKTRLRKLAIRGECSERNRRHAGWLAKIEAGSPLSESSVGDGAFFEAEHAQGAGL